MNKKKKNHLKYSLKRKKPLDIGVIQFSKTFCFNYKSPQILNRISCLLCNNISTVPKICKSCNITYCYYCSKDIEVKKKANCNKCGNDLILENPDKELENLLRSLKVRCLNYNISNEESCKQILNIENLMEHFVRCKFSRGYAKCLGCNIEGLYDEILIHSQTCGDIIKKCGICEEKIKNKFFEEHEKICLSRITKCEICLKEVTYREIKEHEMSKECFLNKFKNMEDKYEGNFF